MPSDTGGWDTLAELHKRRVRLALDMLEASGRLERTSHDAVRTMLRQAAAMLVQNWQDAAEDREPVASRGDAVPPAAAPPPNPDPVSPREPRPVRAKAIVPAVVPAIVPAVRLEPVVDIGSGAERTDGARRLFARTRSPAHAWRAGSTIDAVPSLERVFAADEALDTPPMRRVNWPLFAVSFAAGLGGPAAAMLIFRNGTAVAHADDWLSITLFGFVAIEAVFGVIAARVLWPLWKQRRWGLLTDLFRADAGT